jgi:hypothetical protein
LPAIGILMGVVFACGGIAIDVGRALYSYEQLQASTDASALAGAQALPSSTAVTVATQYSSVTGNLNAYSTLPGVKMVSGYPKIECLATLQNQGEACSAPDNGNAMRVEQTVQIPMYFLALVGKSSLTLTASATASMRGSSGTPYNVVIIVDSTSSMSDFDSDSQCNTTRLACALQGVQTLLKNFSPCMANLSTCGTITNGNVSNALVHVSIFTFPNVTVGTASDDYDCSSSKPTIPVYSLPATTITSYAPTGSSTATYLITPFQSDYRSSDTSTSLVTGSIVTLAAGGKSGCPGIANPGGDGTYYASVLYAAQGALIAQQAANPGSKNVIILLSDGDATATKSQMASTATNNGLYPSYANECTQAIVAAKAIAAAGTIIYSVAYGAESSGCSTDTSGTYAGITPCQTMQNIASASQYFYSDYTQGGGSSSCVSASQPTSSLVQIFTDIASDLTTGRLIPDSTQ